MGPTQICRRALIKGLACSVGGRTGRANNLLHPVPDNFFGIHLSHNAPSSISGLKQTPFPQSLAAKGVRLWDDQTDWKDINPAPGVFKWDITDYAIETSRKFNCDVLMTLGQTPDWAVLNEGANNKAFSPPARLHDWQNYVAAVCKRYSKSISAFEIWNEPDSGYFSGTVEDMVALAKAAYVIIKSFNPQATVLTPSFAVLKPELLRGSKLFPKVNITSYLLAGGAACADAVAIHAYPSGGDRPESLEPLMSEFRRILDANGCASLPIWDTESGQREWRDSRGLLMNHPPNFNNPLPRSPIDLQAAYVTRHFLCLLAEGAVSRSYYYKYDNGDGNGRTRSVMSIWMTKYPDNPRKMMRPARAFAYVAHLLSGGNIGNFQKRDRLFSLEFKCRTGESGQAVWCDDYERLPVTMAANFSKILDNVGVSLPVGAGPLMASGSPIFLFD